MNEKRSNKIKGVLFHIDDGFLVNGALFHINDEPRLVLNRHRIIYQGYLISLATFLAAAPLAVGAVHAGVVVGLFVAVLGLLLLQRSVLRKEQVEGVRVSLPALGFAFFALLCLVQLVPLPLGLVEWLSPARAGHLSAAWQLVFPAQDLAQTGLWGPLSMDPAETADRGLRWMTVLLTAVLAANHARLPHAWRDGLRIVTGAGVVVLLMGAIQTFAGAEKILFIYEPRAPMRAFSTFVNPNQAAVFYGFAALSAFALALKRFERHFVEALLASVAGLVFMVVMAEQNSDGANIGFFLAFIALGAFFLQGKQSERFLPRDKARKLAAVLLAVPIVAPVVAFLSLKVGPAPLSQWVSETVLGIWAQERGNARLDMMAAALDSAGDYPLLGAGAGATRRVLPAYIDWGNIRPATIPTIENETVQWIFEFGWAAAILVILCLISYLYFAARGHLRGRKSRYGVGVAVWIFLAFNTQFHFPFFAIGSSLGAIFLLELTIARTSPTPTSNPALGSFCLATPRTQWLFFGGALFVGLIFMGAMGAYQIDMDSLSTRSSETQSGSGKSEESSRKHASENDRNTVPGTPLDAKEVRKMLLRTPTEGDIFAHLAGTLLRGADVEVQGETNQMRAARFATHAARLKPTAPMLLFAAQIYQRAGQSERALETIQQVYSPKFTQIPRRWLEDLVYPTLREPEVLAVGLEQSDAAVWRQMASLVRRRQGKSGEAVFAQKLVEIRPDHPAPYEILIEHYLRAKEYELAEIWSRLLISRDLEGTAGDKPTGWAQLARSVRAQRGDAAARAVLIGAIKTAPDKSEGSSGADQVQKATRISQPIGEYLVTLRSTEPTEGQPDEAEALSAFRQAFCAHPTTRGLRQQCWLAEGWLDEYEGRFDDADYAYRRLHLRLRQPRHYADFLARRGRCIDLNQFIVDVEANQSASASSIKQIKRLTSKCAQNARKPRPE